MIRILHIDDENNEFLLLEYKLKAVASDLEVKWVGSAREALDFLEEEKIDCFLSDYQMPEMDGLEFLKILRSQNNHTPFIFLTGQGNEKLAIEALRAGADDYYTKDEGFAHYDRLVNSVRLHVETSKIREEREIAEEALRRSNQKLALHFDKAPLGFIEWDLDIHVVEWNPAAEKIFGYSREEAIGRHPEELIIPEKAKGQVKKVWRDILNERGGGYSRNENSTKAAGIIECDWYNTPLINDAGEVFAVASIIEDVTEQMRAEEALRKSQEHYQNFFENALVGLFRSRISDGLFIEMNAKAALQMGLPIDELVGKMRASDLYQNLGKRKELLSILEKYGEAYGFEIDLTLPDGRDVTFAISVKAYPDKDYMEGAVIDITEQKRAESELRILSRAVEQSPASIVITDVKGRIEYVNPKFTQLTGYTFEEVFGQNPRILRTDTQPDSFYKEMWDTIGKGNEWRGEFHNIKKNGESYWEQAYISPVKNSEEEIIHFIAVKEDITDRKKAQEALEISEERWHSLTSNTNDIIQIIDASGIILYANRVYPPHVMEDVIGHSIYDFISEEYIQTIRDKIKKLLDGEGPQTSEIKIRFSESIELYFESKYVPMLEKGKVTRFIAIARDITKRKQSEEVLRESEERYRNFVVNASEGIYRIDFTATIPVDVPDDELIESISRYAIIGEVNEALAKMYGLLPEEMVGRPTTDFAPEYGKRAAMVVRSPQHKISNVETLDVDKNGQPLYLSESFNAVVEDGVLTRIWGMQRNISQRKRNEEKLHMQALVLDQIEDHVLITDLVGIISYVNDAQIRSMGIHRDEFIGNSTEMLGGDPKRGATQKEILEKTLSDGSWRGEVVNHAADGNEVIMDCRTQVILDEEGEPVALCGVAEDITEYKRSEKDLRMSEERFRQLYNNMSCGCAVYETKNGKDFILADYNRAGEMMDGLDKEKIIGQNVVDLFPDPVMRLNALESFNRVWETGIPERFPLTLYKIGDKNVWRDNYLYKLPSGEVVALFDDVTERKQAEERLKEACEELQIANKDLEAFSHTVAHDLKAPLRHIEGFARIMKESYADKLDVDGNNYLQAIFDSSINAGQLIEDILRFSRTARSDIKKENVNLSEIAERIALKLKDENPNREVEFQITPMMEILGDERLFAIVVENLLSNAWKFSGRNSKAKIAFSVVSIGGEKVFFVKDNGVGFDQADADKIFTPFHRLRSAKDFKGMGIGLSTVQRIIERHGGKIWAESQLGEGASFYFSIKE